MKKIIKNPIFTFILGALIFGGIVGVSAYTIFANDIGYTPKDSTWKKTNGEDITNVKDAIDELYTKANNQKNTFCLYLSGTRGAVGSKYICDPGDGIATNFFILKVDGNNVKLIMEKNLTDESNYSRTMSYTDALQFLENNNIDTLWDNVIDVDLPSAQELVVAGGISNFDESNSYTYYGDSLDGSANYEWLYSYTRGCSTYGRCNNSYSESDSTKSYGYWTKSTVLNDDTNAWVSIRNGRLEKYPITHSTDNGVRPVITVLKSQLN